MFRGNAILFPLRRSVVYHTMSHSPRSTTPSLREQYQSALHKFKESSKSFEIIDSLTLQAHQAAAAPTATAAPAAGTARETQRQTSALFVLDSSFNPPTLAHLHIARSALVSSSPFFSAKAQRDQHPTRLLLLLATQNADKPTKPALFEDRLAMMKLFGQELLDSLRQSYTKANSLKGSSDQNNHDNSGGSTSPDVAIDIGVTSLPYFIDKASSITRSNTYSPPDVQQTHLTGYDTLIRIFEPKYYPPSHSLEPLGPFLSKHRLRVTMRPDDGWGGVEEQKTFLECLRNGALESVGGKKEWAEKIEMVEGTTDEENGAVSSTRARALGAAGDREGLARLVTPRVATYVLQGCYSSLS